MGELLFLIGDAEEEEAEGEQGRGIEIILPLLMLGIGYLLGYKGNAIIEGFYSKPFVQTLYKFGNIMALNSLIFTFLYTLWRFLIILGKF